MADIKTILAIETSLDDTCAAVTREDRVVSNVVASQVAFHEEFGGTVPDIAKRMHLKWIDRVVDEALHKAKVTMDNVDAVAVTYGPGLAPSLEVGIGKARELATTHRKPLVPVNHLEGHLLSSLVYPPPRSTQPRTPRGSLTSPGGRIQFPALGFVISGGHTELILVNAIGDYTLLGETLDDAAGEAYDKVARMLKLGYPGGPILTELAKEGRPLYSFPVAMRDRQDLNFSFSGLKTAAMNKLKTLNADLTRDFCADFAASFEKAVIDSLMLKFRKAIERYAPKTILLGGGVVSSIAIRSAARKTARKYDVPVVIPYSKRVFTDNAAMIGVVAWYQTQQGRVVNNPMAIERQPNLNFPKVED